MKRNPTYGTHPDLFSKTDTPVFVDLSELSWDELSKLFPIDFSIEELETIQNDDSDLYAEIIGNNREFVEKIGERVKKLAEAERDRRTTGIEAQNISRSIFNERNINVDDVLEEDEAYSLINVDKIDEGKLKRILSDSSVWIFGWTDKPSPRHTFEFEIEEEIKLVIHAKDLCDAQDEKKIIRFVDEDNVFLEETVNPSMKSYRNYSAAIYVSKFNPWKKDAENTITVSIPVDGSYVADVNWDAVKNIAHGRGAVKRKIINARESVSFHYLAACANT